MKAALENLDDQLAEIRNKVDDAKRSDDDTTRTQALKDIYARKKETAKENAKKADQKTGTFKIVMVGILLSVLSTHLLIRYYRTVMTSSTPTSPTMARRVLPSECSRLKTLLLPVGNGDHPLSTCSTDLTQPLLVNITRKPSRELVQVNTPTF